MFERLHSQKNYMQIAQQIRNMIRDGKLNVGDKLPAERDLVQQFGASRASVREALSALEMLGLIPSDRMRLPMVQASPVERHILQSVLEQHGILARG